jgi:hypothetical protein
MDSKYSQKVRPKYTALKYTARIKYIPKTQLKIPVLSYGLIIRPKYTAN